MVDDWRLGDALSLIYYRRFFTHVGRARKLRVPVSPGILGLFIISHSPKMTSPCTHSYFYSVVPSFKGFVASKG